MPIHLFAVVTYAVPGAEETLERWYVEQHIPDLLKVPGITGARRYTADAVKLPAGMATPASVVLYTIDSEDPRAVLQETGQRMGTPAMPSTPALDSDRTIALLATPAHETAGRSPGARAAGDGAPLFFAATYAKPGRAQELFDCYDDAHVPDLIDIPGIGTVVRYAVQVVKLPAGVPAPAALLLHALDPADPGAVIEEVKRSAAAGQIRHTDALDGSRSIVFVLKPA